MSGGTATAAEWGGGTSAGVGVDDAADVWGGAADLWTGGPSAAEVAEENQTVELQAVGANDAAAEVGWASEEDEAEADAEADAAAAAEAEAAEVAAEAAAEEDWALGDDKLRALVEGVESVLVDVAADDEAVSNAPPAPCHLAKWALRRSVTELRLGKPSVCLR